MNYCKENRANICLRSLYQKNDRVVTLISLGNGKLALGSVQQGMMRFVAFVTAGVLSPTFTAIMSKNEASEAMVSCGT